ATFSGGNRDEPTGHFTASIDWGAGSGVTAGVITGGSGNFSVAGNHTYADEGVDPVSVTITRTSDSAATVAHGNVTVAEHDALTYHGVATVNETRGVATGSMVVATFTNTDLITPAGDFTATIDWGDGTGVTAGVIGVLGAGNFSVSGNHTYSAVGNQTVHVTLTDDAPGTAAASGNSTILVNRGVLGSTETLV